MIYLSTSCLGGSLLDALRRPGAWPADLGLELGAGLDRAEALALVAVLEREAAPRAVVHNYFPPPAEPFVLNLASLRPEIRGRSLALCREALEVCARLDAPFYSVHAGLAVDPAPGDLGRPLTEYPAADLAKAAEVFRQSITELADQARNLGVRLLVENNVLAEFNAPDRINRLALLCSPEDLEAFGREHPRENVGLLLDLGHLKVSAQTLGFDALRAAQDAASRVEALHLHDNDGRSDTHLGFGADVWFGGLLADLAQRVAMILEVTPASWEELQVLVALAADLGGHGQAKGLRA